MSQKTYADPFNDVEVDVIFTKEGRSWRVPTFWRGGQKWTVRFAPPVEGDYFYRLQSTDPDNPDLNGHDGKVRIAPYSGSDPVLKHGMVRISENGRHFEYEDGTPFFWLGDTWWTGLSDRLTWEGFRKLAADRKAKGFTVVQIVAGLVPPEELAPTDPGYRNEGGAVWDPKFEQINPQYFDFADRRIQYLLEQGLTPAIVGAWGPLIKKTGISALKKHWRYIVARYGAYPVFWIVGGEVFDPPEQVTEIFSGSSQPKMQRGWTDITRYLRTIDPYHHPLTVHEAVPPFDFPVQDESLTDFDMFQSGHFGWGSIATEVAQMNMHYARTSVIKPLVEGEVGYERLGEIHLGDFQRTAFWLSMLNGAAGHTYGANGTFEAYTSEKPLHRLRWSFLTWEEGMNLPGSSQVGLSATLLRRYRWWKLQPHPEWVTPRGSTLLEPQKAINGFDIGRGVLQVQRNSVDGLGEELEANYPGGAWNAKNGNFRLPYAAGIPGELRIIYIPTRLIFLPSPAPTVLGLEPGVRYHAHFIEPTTGTLIDLGIVERRPPGRKVFSDTFEKRSGAWAEHGTSVSDNCLHSADGHALRTLNGIRETNAVVTVEASGAVQAGLLLRYHDPSNYVAAIYSPETKELSLLDRHDALESRLLGKTEVSSLSTRIKLSAEVRENKAVASVTDGQVTYTTPIVDIADTTAGSVGLLQLCDGAAQSFKNFELRRSPVLIEDRTLQRHMYDAQGLHRGDLIGAAAMVESSTMQGWSDFGRDKHILLDAYRPEKLPTSGDWILVLEAKNGHEKSRNPASD